MSEKECFRREHLDTLYREQSRRIFAPLVRLLGDFDLAEEALHDAFAGAATQWPAEGVPANPSAWLISVGRFRAIDRLRRKARLQAAQAEISEVLHAPREPDSEPDAVSADDRLGLIFTCCHPALSADAQVALTLREVCGLTTEQIARAFLTAPTTIAQRIVRAKTKIREANIPFETPAPSELGERMAAVLRVIYLVFNEGYSATSGASVTRADLSGR